MPKTKVSADRLIAELNAAHEKEAGYDAGNPFMAAPGNATGRAITGYTTKGDEVARLVNDCRKRPLEVPLPYKLAFDADPFLGGGSNWHMPKFRHQRGNEAAIGRAVMDVKARWSLKD